MNLIEDGTNWFAYVSNDPVNFTDPLGLEILDVGGEYHMNDEGNTDELGGSDYLICEAGCLLTADTRVANDINGSNDISPSEANQTAIDGNIYAGEDENLLGGQASRDLIDELTPNHSITRETVYDDPDTPHNEAVEAAREIDESNEDDAYVTAHYETSSGSDHFVNVDSIDEDTVYTTNTWGGGRNSVDENEIDRVDITRAEKNS